jgi:hypothetical protein
MRYVYSLIRFVPDPKRGEFVNVGAIVGSEESSEWEIRQIENPIRARALDESGTLDVVWAFTDQLGRQIDEYEASLETAQEPSEELSEPWLQHVHEMHRNIVQLSPPIPMVAENASEALDRVFDLMLKDPARVTYRFAKKNRALAAVRNAFREAGLEKNQHLFERGIVQTEQHRERVDFAVVNGRALQLTQTWSFQIPGQETLAEQVKSWGWTMRRVKEQGGELLVSSREPFTVDQDVDVEVVYVPPLPETPAPALAEALSVFATVNARVVTDTEASLVAESALKRLAG